MRQRMTNAVAPLGLTAQQAAVLLTLSDGPLPLSQVAERLGMDRPTMSGLAERLVRDRWVAVAPNPADRRSRLAELSPRAVGILPALRRAADEVNAEALRDLGDAEREQLLSLLGSLATALDS